MYMIIFVQFSPRGPPERNNYPGEFNFCVEVNSNDVHKKTFLVSAVAMMAVLYDIYTKQTINLIRRVLNSISPHI